MVTFIGLCMIIGSAYGIIRLNKHAFYRRNSAGVEEFSSYGDMVKTRFKEGAAGTVLAIVLIAGGGCFVGGLIM